MTRLGSIREAVGLLTIVPAGGGTGSQDDSRDRAAWFPWVGAALGLGGLAAVGLTVAGSQALSDGWMLGRAGFLLAALVVGMWAVATRFLHWDGLADTADAIWGGPTPERRLEIMKDSVVGSFGVTAIVLVAAIQISALGSLLTYTSPWTWGTAIVAAPVTGRLAATFACWLGVPARPDGLGRSLAVRPSAGGIVVVFLLLLAITAVLVLSGTLRWALWWPASLLAALVVPHLLARSVGGVTGDTMGASIVIVEAVVLGLAALAGAL